MEYYRFGTAAGLFAPGGMTLIGLMRALTMPDGSSPASLALLKGQMGTARCSTPTTADVGFLVHILAGAASVTIAGESVRLITDNSVYIPAQVSFSFSTRETTGITALVIVPQVEWAVRADNAPLSSCLPDTLSIEGEPQVMAASSLDILCSLGRLTTEGCTIAGPALARGNFHRDVIVASLLPRYAADPLALRALAWTCNAHPAAPWWLEQQRAQSRLAEEIEQLLTQ